MDHFWVPSANLSGTGVTRGLVHCAALSARLLVRNLVAFLLRNLVAASLTMSSLISSGSSPFPHEIVGSLGEVQRVGLHLISRVLYVQAPMYSVLVTPTSASSIVDWLEASTNSEEGVYDSGIKVKVFIYLTYSVVHLSS